MKRFASLLLALALVLGCATAVSAATGGVVSPMSSPTITKTLATTYTGDNTGEVDIEYNITATSIADRLGVSSIVVYKPDGTTDTITGTVSNGLIGSGISHLGTYTYTGVSGKYYYAVVTLFSTIGSTTDSRTITTRSSMAR